MATWRLEWRVGDRWVAAHGVYVSKEAAMQAGLLGQEQNGTEWRVVEAGCGWRGSMSVSEVRRMYEGDEFSPPSGG